MGWMSVGVLVLVVMGLVVGGASPGTSVQASEAGGIHKIKHVVVIMQENRSFDSYFGTYPGADGIPMNNGKPTVCVPDPQSGQCVAPVVDHADVNGGGPHSANNAVADVNGGTMDGFVAQVLQAKKRCANPTNPACTNSATPDVMGYHTQSDIPNYWTYANDFVLQDHMFEPNASWSLPEHLFQVSEWSARCTQHDNPSSCVNELQNPGIPPDRRRTRSGLPVQPPIYAWTDLTYLLHKEGVSWGYYVVAGTEPDCENDAALSCTPVRQNATTPGIWNPLPYFDTVKADGQLGNIQSVDQLLHRGQERAAARRVLGRALRSSQRTPPERGQRRPGLCDQPHQRGHAKQRLELHRDLPGLGRLGRLLRPRPPRPSTSTATACGSRHRHQPLRQNGSIDHQTLSFDAYDKFIEDDFLHGQRLDPHTDGRPDPRPDVRENVKILGNLTADFNFNQKPVKPVILPVHPATTLTKTSIPSTSSPPANATG